MFWPNLSTIPVANSLARTRYFHRSIGSLHATILILKAKVYNNMQVGSSVSKSLNATEWSLTCLIQIYIHIYIYFAEEVGTPWTQQEDLWEKQHYNK